MTNPWLEIPLSDYEGHMGLPQVAQGQLLADVFAEMLEEYRPRSVAVLGCAGGNGFERISTQTTSRVVGVDLNPAYIDRLRTRFQGTIPGLELIAGDIQGDTVRFEPVELAFAALLFEYVDVPAVLDRIRSLVTVGGVLGTVLQLPSEIAPSVTPSPFSSLKALSAIMRLVSPDQLRAHAERGGYRQIASERKASRAGKQFQVQAFRLQTPNPMT